MGTSAARPGYLRSVGLNGSPSGGYPFDIPAVAALVDGIDLGAVTMIVGANGSGKSTMIEAIAMAAGLNAEGGGRGLRFETNATHSELWKYMRLSWIRQSQWGWFLRAETFYGLATHVDADDDPVYGIKQMFPDLHAVSHGESFLSIIEHRFTGQGLYLMDEPEAALSFEGQLRLLRFVHDGVSEGAQFIISTHSPILMRIPGAVTYELDDHGITRRDWDDLAVVNLWRRFLHAPERFIDTLLADD